MAFGKHPWNISISIPAYELDIDTEKEEYEVTVEFDYYPADKEVGIMSDSMSLKDWRIDSGQDFDEEDEEEVCKWIGQHEDELCDKAFERYCDYCDYIKYGNI